MSHVDSEDASGQQDSNKDEVTVAELLKESPDEQSASTLSCLTRPCCWGYCSLGTIVVTLVLLYFSWSAYMITGLVAPQLSEVDEHGQYKPAMAPAWAEGERVRTILYGCKGRPAFKGRSHDSPLLINPGLIFGVYDHGFALDGSPHGTSGADHALEKAAISLCSPAALEAGRVLRRSGRAADGDGSNDSPSESEDEARAQAARDCIAGLLVANATARGMGLAALAGPRLGLGPGGHGWRVFENGSSSSPVPAGDSVATARRTQLGLGTPGPQRETDEHGDTVAGLVGQGSGIIPALVRWGVSAIGTAARSKGAAHDGADGVEDSVRALVEAWRARGSKVGDWSAELQQAREFLRSFEELDTAHSSHEVDAHAHGVQSEGSESGAHWVLPRGALELMPWNGKSAAAVRSFAQALYAGKESSAKLCSVSVLLEREPVESADPSTGAAVASPGSRGDGRPVFWRRVVSAGPMIRQAEFKPTPKRMFLLTGNTTQNWTRIDWEKGQAEARVHSAWNRTLRAKESKLRRLGYSGEDLEEQLAEVAKPADLVPHLASRAQVRIVMDGNRYPVDEVPALMRYRLQTVQLSRAKRANAAVRKARKALGLDDHALSTDLEANAAAIESLPLWLRDGQQPRKDSGVRYLPVSYANELKPTRDHLVYLNESNDGLLLPLQLDVEVAGPTRVMFMDIMSQAMGQMEALSAGEKETDDVIGLFTETPMWLLVLTFAISVAHICLDVLSFLSDLEYWQNAKRLRGLSASVLQTNLVMQVVIGLYLYENGASLLVTVPHFAMLFMQGWKVCKAYGIVWDGASLEHTGTKGLWGHTLGLPWPRYDEQLARSAMATYSRTAKYDREATHSLYLVMVPLVVGAALHSLVHSEHKSWYDWSLSAGVGAVYAFGFVAMTPQLWVNYRLKSVRALPWKHLAYRSINTFIDDIFAFVIRMPLLHRISVFRDDLIFFLYLGQRCMYPVSSDRPAEETDEDGNVLGDDEAVGLVGEGGEEKGESNAIGSDPGNENGRTDGVRLRKVVAAAPASETGPKH